MGKGGGKKHVSLCAPLSICEMGQKTQSFGSSSVQAVRNSRGRRKALAVTTAKRAERFGKLWNRKMHPKNQKNIQKNSIQRRRTVTAARLVAARFRKPSKTEVKAGKYTKKSRKIDKRNPRSYIILLKIPLYTRPYSGYSRPKTSSP